MSISNIKAFNDKIAQDEGLLMQLKEVAGDVEKYLALAKENGFEISKEDLNAYEKELKSEGSLSDEDLDKVAGGGVNFKTISI